MRFPRFYPILDTSRPLSALTQAQAMRAGGVSFLQIRHKTPWTRDMFAFVEQIAELGGDLIVNDRPDIARMLNAGVHVGQTDLNPSEARRIVGDAAVGCSTHNREQFEDALTQPVDYIAVGPIFATVSKDNPDPVIGLELLRQLRPMTSKPLVAIGGITRANALDAIAAGADSVAVIGDLYPPELTAHSLRARIEEWLNLLN